MPDLSIVVPSCDRAQLLEKCLTAIERGTACDYQIVVVDGASTDETPAVLEAARGRIRRRLLVIREKRREGFVRAVNKGFLAATGKFMLWINDDAMPLAGSLDGALGQIGSAKADVGMIALFHRWSSPRNVAYEMRLEGRNYRLLHVRGTLYANFGMARRQTFASLGYFDERYYFNGADPDFGLKVWNAGMRIEPAYGAAVDHAEHEDSRRQADADRGRADNSKLFEKWELPEKNLLRNDFNPGRPCTLRGLRAAAAVAV
jgi:GT2 family glycosyltransferase